MSEQQQTASRRLSPERLAEIRERQSQRTPGPYRWVVRESMKTAHLLADRGRRPIVLAFDRWGFLSAAPVFRDAAQDLLYRIEHWIKRHIPGAPPIDHPDAIGLAASWGDIDALLQHADALEAALHPTPTDAAWRRLQADLADLKDIELTPEEDLQAEVLALRSDNRIYRERLAALEQQATGPAPGGEQR